MAQYESLGKLWLRRNKEKRGERDPDYKGSGYILVGRDEQDVWVSGWINDDESRDARPGDKVLALNIQPREKRRETSPRRSARSDDRPRQTDRSDTGRRDDLDDEIPF